MHALTMAEKQSCAARCQGTESPAHLTKSVGKKGQSCWESPAPCRIEPCSSQAFSLQRACFSCAERWNEALHVFSRLLLVQEGAQRSGVRSSFRGTAVVQSSHVHYFISHNLLQCDVIYSRAISSPRTLERGSVF